MPMPVSCTEISNIAVAVSAVTDRTAIDTCPPSVNLMALETRFKSICRRRVGSDWIRSGTESSQVARNSMPLSNACRPETFALR